MQELQRRETPEYPKLEEALLSSCLMEKAPRDYVLNYLERDDFYNYPDVYDNFKRQMDETGQIDGVVAEQETGHIVPLFDMQLALTRYETYGQKLIDAKQRRQSLAEMQVIWRSLWDLNSDIGESKEKLEQMLDMMNGATGTETALTVPEILERDKHKPKAEQLTTGVYQFDESLYAESGLKRGHYHLILAESGHGKTQYMMFLASLLLKNGHKGLWVQLEDYDSKTAKFMGAQIGEHSENLWVMDSKFDLRQIEREARILNKKYGLDFVAIDYIQKVRNSMKSRVEKLEHTSDSLQKLFIELGVVGFVASQVTINTNDRSGYQRFPTQEDVRYSQDIKQDAHMISSVFRPSKIEKLVLSIAGDPYVKSPNDGKPTDYNSVYVRQAKVRDGVQKFFNVHLKHTESRGLQMYSDLEDFNLN